MSNAKVLYDMLKNTFENGSEISPRGLPIKEIRNLQIEVDPINPFMGFIDRKYDVNYFKKEMLWKLGANRMDDSIKKHAKMWESVQNLDGSFNSNYGHYWFGPQMGFWNVIQELIRDQDSRQAVIPMLSKEHMYPDVIDRVCTTAVGFHIRDQTLYMSVQMRSSDQIFGLGTDIPTFSFLYRLVHAVLDDYQNNLFIGTINITAMSSHIYSRHFKMVQDILSAGPDKYQMIDMPWFNTSVEAIETISNKGKIPVYKSLCDVEAWLHASN